MKQHIKLDSISRLFISCYKSLFLLATFNKINIHYVIDEKGHFSKYILIKYMLRRLNSPLKCALYTWSWKGTIQRAYQQGKGPGVSRACRTTRQTGQRALQLYYTERETLNITTKNQNIKCYWNINYIKYQTIWYNK